MGKIYVSVSVKVETRSTSRLISTLYILLLFYLRALTCRAKNASVEIHPNVTYVSGMCLYGQLSAKVFITLEQVITSVVEKKKNNLNDQNFKVYWKIRIEDRRLVRKNRGSW